MTLTIEELAVTLIGLAVFACLAVFVPSFRSTNHEARE